MENNFYEKTLEKNILFYGRVVNVETQTVELVNGNISYREILRHDGGACMVALDDERNIFLVKQYRKAIEKHTLEIPAGKLEKNEEPIQCAIRELREETGLIPGKVVSLGYIYPSPGFCDEKLYLFLATDLTQSQMSPDPDELLDVVKLSLKESLELIAEGEITDSKTVVALYRTALHLEQNRL